VWNPHGQRKYIPLPAHRGFYPYSGPGDYSTPTDPLAGLMVWALGKEGDDGTRRKEKRAEERNGKIVKRNGGKK